MPGTKTYFAADFHLGARYIENPLEYERRIVRWLDSIKADAGTLYLLGDILDYWYEYRYVVPRGFTRFFGKLAELSDSGVDIHWFIGNHDIWIFDYLPAELGVTVVDGEKIVETGGKTFFLAHGDSVGRRKRSFRMLRAIFRNKTCQKLYSAIHPRWTIPFALRWSESSRSGDDYPEYLGEGNEYLEEFANSYQVQHIDYFIFGHRHIMLDLMLSATARVTILGDWITHFSYAVFDGETLVLDRFVEGEDDAGRRSY